MEKFLEKHKLSNFTQEEMDNRNSPISIQAIEFVVMSFPIKKTPSPNCSLENFTVHFQARYNNKSIQTLP